MQTKTRQIKTRPDRRMKILSFSALLFIAVVSVSVACSSSGSNSQAEARITVANGGELRAPDGSFVLSVPPGAVSEDVDIAFKEVSSEEAPSTISDAEGTGYELTPDGLQFSLPARVTITLPGDELGIDDETQEVPTYDLFTVSSDDEVTALEETEAEFDTAKSEMVLTAELSHFSKLYRSKRNVAVTLSQISGSLTVGQPVFVGAGTFSSTDRITHSTTWVLEALSNTQWDVPNTSVVSDKEGAGLIRELTFTGDNKRLSGAFNLQRTEGINVQTNLICTAVGTGIYSFSVVATPVLTGSSGANPRPIRISLTATVPCISVADADETAAAGIQATLRAGGADRIFTPTPAPPGFVATATPTPRPTPALEPTARPTATPSPRPGASPTPRPTAIAGELVIRVIASTGQLVPGELAVFSGFEVPQVSTDTGALFAFDSENGTGIWRFDQAAQGDAGLVAFAQSFSPPDNGQYAFLSGHVMNQSGSLAFIGRLKIDNDFTEGVFLVNPNGSLIEVALEGQDAPGTEAKFTQFDTVQLTDSGKVLFTSPAGGRGYWLWDNGALRHVITEGDALPGLAADWRNTSSGRMFSPGVADDGSVLFAIPNYRRSLPGGNEQTQRGGIWLLKPGGDQLIADVGMSAPDLTTFTRFLDPSINASGRVAFSAMSELQIGSELFINRAIWKTDAAGALVKVAEPGIKVGTDNTEMLEVSSPIIQRDHSVVFVGTAFDSTNSLISFLLRGTDSGIEVLARTDALTGPNGVVSLVPSAIGNIGTNSSGAVVFTVGFLSDAWIWTPDGAVRRIIGPGDQLEVPTPGGSEPRTVSFIEFAGGASNGTGSPSGLSDDADIVVKVTFTDQSTAIVLATFTDDS